MFFLPGSLTGLKILIRVLKVSSTLKVFSVDRENKVTSVSPSRHDASPPLFSPLIRLIYFQLFVSSDDYRQVASPRSGGFGV